MADQSLGLSINERRGKRYTYVRRRFRLLIKTRLRDEGDWLREGITTTTTTIRLYNPTTLLHPCIYRRRCKERDIDQERVETVGWQRGTARNYYLGDRVSAQCVCMLQCNGVSADGENYQSVAVIRPPKRIYTPACIVNKCRISHRIAMQLKIKIRPQMRDLIKNTLRQHQRYQPATVIRYTNKFYTLQSTGHHISTLFYPLRTYTTQPYIVCSNLRHYVN